MGNLIFKLHEKVYHYTVFDNAKSPVAGFSLQDTKYFKIL